MSTSTDNSTWEPPQRPAEHGRLDAAEVNHPNVQSLVYVNAFQPDVGETAGGLQARTPPASTNVMSVGGGVVQERPETFETHFAADVALIESATKDAK